jgi:hydrogenase/urease accessory protein HupE
VTRRLGLAMALLVAAAAAADAHPLAPALLEVHERAGGRAEVLWKTPVLRLRGAHPEPVLPPRCRPLGPPTTATDGAGVERRWTVDCGPGGLVGATLRVDGLETAKAPALVRVVLADGRVARAVLVASSDTLRVSARPSRLGVAWSYLVLGVEHILSGTDHLLFVLGLLLLATTRRRLLATVSAFTAGHSVTLSLAALGLATVPSGPVELGIAASVYVLAVELARAPVRPTLMRRWPWVMAGAFGLLHGLGFAAALREAGLPDGEVPLALLAFNGGVEVGQLVVVGTALGLAALFAARLAPRWGATGWLRRAPVYAMGAVAAGWMLERAAAMF